MLLALIRLSYRNAKGEGFDIEISAVIFVVSYAVYLFLSLFH